MGGSARPHVRRAPALVALALVAGALAVAAPGGSALASAHGGASAHHAKHGHHAHHAHARSTDVRVRRTLFGAQDASVDSASLTRIHEGSVRLWGVGVNWNQVETAPGVYDWTRLDQLVAAAQAAHAEVLMTVAMTPSFYAPVPTDPPSTVGPYARFVRALMTRYRSFNGARGISEYQVWNEANISTFWTGTTRKLAQLTQAMARARDQLDPQARVIGPAMVTRLNFELRGIASYYDYRLHGVPVWRYLDAVSLNMYPMPQYGSRPGVPEDSIRCLHAVQRVLRASHVPASLPIWNTEVNYGVNVGPMSGTPAIPISTTAQASNVVRTYLLNAANGVSRVFWYRYDMGRNSTGGTIGDTLLSTPREPDEISPAGLAYVLVQQWMHGTLVGSHGQPPCARDKHGTYTCVVRDSTGTRRIYWNPFHHAKVTLAGNAHRTQDALGTITLVDPGSRLRVGPTPVMVTR
jgi:hypothetical protein